MIEDKGNYLATMEAQSLRDQIYYLQEQLDRAERFTLGILRMLLDNHAICEQMHVWKHDLKQL